MTYIVMFSCILSLTPFPPRWTTVSRNSDAKSCRPGCQWLQTSQASTRLRRSVSLTSTTSYLYQTKLYVLKWPILNYGHANHCMLNLYSFHFCTCCHGNRYHLMLSCWRSEPQARLSFTQLKYSFKSIVAEHNKVTNYITVQPNTALFSNFEGNKTSLCEEDCQVEVA